MKKKLSLMLALVMMVSLFPIVHAEAAFSNVSDRPQYIAEDFEDGFDSSKTAEICGTATWTQTDTHNGSKGALLFTPTNTKYKSVLYPLRTEPGNTYYISAWVKFKEQAPAATAAEGMSFVIRYTCEDGTGGFNEIKATPTGGSFEVGQWVEITAKFTANGTCTPNSGGSKKACLPNGTIDFRVAKDNTAYGPFVLDDFYVFPDVASTTDDIVFSDSFETEEEMTATWKSSVSTYNPMQWIEEGANGSTGAMQITTTGLNRLDEALTKDPVNFRFLKKYRLSFWVKAMNDAAVGKKPKYILLYNSSSTATDPAVQTNYTVEAYSDVTLTTEWQKVEFDIHGTTSSTEETFPQLRLRLGELDETRTIPLSYAVDEISLTRVGGENGDVFVSGQRSASTPNGIVYQMSTSGTRKTFLYRLYQETASGDVLLANGQTKEGYLSFATSSLPTDLSSLRLDVVTCSSNGTCSEVTSCYLKESEQEDSMSMACDQYIWTNDVNTLSATVRYINDNAPDSITAYVAQYDSQKRLLGVTPATKPVAANEDASWQVTASVFPTAVKAKFFAWYTDSVTPVACSCELDKTTTGEFIYVDANQATNGDGSFATPFNTIGAAKEYLRTRLTASSATDFYVVLKGGEYTNNYETLTFNAQDGAEGKNITYTSLGADRAKITGAKHISGASFTLHDSSKNIWKASVPAGTETRQLYVNGIKATRARSAEDAIPFINKDRHNPAYKSDSSKSMVFEAEPFNNLGITTTDTSFLSYAHIDELEMYFASQWRHQFICPDTVEAATDDDGNQVANFKFTTDTQINEWHWLNRDNAPVREVLYVENAYELIDEPGEWYLDTNVTPHVLYYKPRSFETLSTADVVIPVTQKLLSVRGARPVDVGEAAFVRNIAFKNIDFEYAGWNRPTELRGFRNGQNATFEDTSQNTETFEYTTSGGRMMIGAVEVAQARSITFDNCDFSKIGSSGLKVYGSVQDSNITGNEFYEIAGSAINFGEVGTVDGKLSYGVDVWGNEETGTPTDYVDQIHRLKNNLIANNYIHKVATEHRSAAAIGAGFPVDTVIRNNDLSDGAYSGMHTGWHWMPQHFITTGFKIEKNYIHDFMNWRLYDGGGIYMLGGTSGRGESRTDEKDPKNYVRGNYFQDIQNAYGGVYPDEGSNGWWVEENVLDLSNYPILYGTEDMLTTNRWLHIHTSSISDINTDNNYSTTAIHRNLGTDINYEEPALYPDANWPTAAQQIIEEAGIEKQYLNRFDFELQTLRMPQMVETAAGKTVNLVYSGISSKDRSVDLTDYQITAKSSNTAVATATANSVTGLSSGTAWITLEVLKQDANGTVQFYDEFTFRVVVK